MGAQTVVAASAIVFFTFTSYFPLGSSSLPGLLKMAFGSAVPTGSYLPIMQENQSLTQDPRDHSIRGRLFLLLHEACILVLAQSPEAGEWSQCYGCPGRRHEIRRT